MTARDFASIDSTVHVHALTSASTDGELSEAVLTLAHALAEGRAFLHEEAREILDALEWIDPHDLDVPDLWSAVRVALAYDDRTGLQGLGFTVEG